MQQRTPLDLNRVNLRSHPGLTNEDVVELQQLGHGSVQSLMNLADQHNGNFTLISSPAIVIDEGQSNRIGEWLLGHPQVPDSWKKKWVPSTATAEQSSAAKAKGTAKEGEKWRIGPFYWK